LQELINKDGIVADMKEAITNSMSRKISFSVYCEQILIGMYVLSKNVNLDYY
jgi:hypothetical protein